jgi:hypothetical protein
MHLGGQKDLKQACQGYLNERCSSYWFRCRRYKAVADKLFELGLKDSHTMFDLGAGRCDFDYYMRTTRKWRGRYVPIDGSIDGTNLEKWFPVEAEWYVAIEVVEHLSFPIHFLWDCMYHVRKGMVITTPNPKTTDVLGMDPTHITPVYANQLRDPLLFKVETRSFFGKPKDSLLAWKLKK